MRCYCRSLDYYAHLAMPSRPHRHYTTAMVGAREYAQSNSNASAVCERFAMQHRHRLSDALANAYTNRFYVLFAIQFLSFCMADLALYYKSKCTHEHTHSTAQTHDRPLIKINITILQSTYTLCAILSAQQRRRRSQWISDFCCCCKCSFIFNREYAQSARTRCEHRCWLGGWDFGRHRRFRVIWVTRHGMADMVSTTCTAPN